MFEKESEIYALSNYGFRGKNSQRVLTAKIDYQDGAEFGYKEGTEKAKEIIENLLPFEHVIDPYAFTSDIEKNKRIFHGPFRKAEQFLKEEICKQ